MARPDDRPLRRLLQLEARKDTLERCVFCPKLCRSACPVSNAEPRETLTPWGKMTTTYLVGTGSVETAPPFAAPAWACTGCFGCRAQCDHKNDVAGTLYEARSALRDAGVAPGAAGRIVDGFADHEAEARKKTQALAVPGLVDPRSRTAVLVGCAYAKRAPHVGRDALRATAALVGGPVALLDACCGAPLLHAGDQRGFRARGEAFARLLRDKDRLVVVDAGCASTLRIHLPAAGVSLPAPVEVFVERAARELGALTTLDACSMTAALGGGGPVRWHDPCQLGRGLGVYDAPRVVLGRLLGRAPDEFPRARDGARCSGAGGLLPVTMPETARAITRTRVDEHEEEGGGTIVTACASSLRAFAGQGARVVDLATLVSRGLGHEPTREPTPGRDTGGEAR
jgi:Fe-S oxidoreductase